LILRFPIAATRRVTAQTGLIRLIREVSSGSAENPSAERV
jgi:hypothetical protein